MHQSRAVQLDAVPGQHLRLAMQWQVPGELCRRHMGQQRDRRQPTLDRTRRRWCLQHGALARAAAVARAANASDPNDRGHDVEHLADILANAMQHAATARAGLDRRLDDYFLARQMARETTDIPHRLTAGRPAKWP